MIPGQAFNADNDKVIALLTRWLAKAKEGNMGFVAMVGFELPNRGMAAVAGMTNVEDVICKYLDAMQTKLQADKKLREFPEEDPNLPANCACYNTLVMTSYFDFAVWLVGAELGRRRAGIVEPLKIAFSRGPVLAPMNEMREDRKFSRVAFPLMKLMGAEFDKEALHGRNKISGMFSEVVTSSRAGEQIPRYKASEEASQFVREQLRGAHPVTITLRESEGWPQRNSNLPEWLKFAEYLKARGEFVVFVRDTARAYETLKGYAIFPDASVDVNVRLALYEQAKQNLFVDNGPFVLALFSKSPFLTFTYLDDNNKYFQNSRIFWRETQHMDAGEQFPWTGERQRVVWEMDTFENMKAAWEKYCVEERIAA